MDGKVLGRELCENVKTVASKYGYTVVCDETDERKNADVVLPAGEGCESAKKVVSKFGYTVVCDEKA